MPSDIRELRVFRMNESMNADSQIIHFSLTANPRPTVLFELEIRRRLLRARAGGVGRTTPSYQGACGASEVTWRLGIAADWV